MSTLIMNIALMRRPVAAKLISIFCPDGRSSAPTAPGASLGPGGHGSTASEDHAATEITFVAIYHMIYIYIYIM